LLLFQKQTLSKNALRKQVEKDRAGKNDEAQAFQDTYLEIFQHSGGSILFLD
jgi:hypothetical protein